jgi:O-antigen/teichoic acid export membrane protein
VAAAAAGTGVLLLRSLQVHFQVAGRFVHYAGVEIAHTALRVALVLLLLAAGVRSAALLLGAYALAPLAILLAGGHVLLRPASLAAWWQPHEWHAVGAFAGITLATCSIGALVARLDFIVLAAAGSPVDLGLFGIASTVAMIPSLAGAYLAPSFSPRIVPFCRDGRFEALFATTQKSLIAAAAVMFTLVAFAMPMVIGTVLPPSYAPAVAVVRVLVVSGLAGFVTFPLTLHFLLFYSPRTYITMDVISVALLVPAYGYAAIHFGALGVAWVTAVATVTKAAIAQLRARYVMRRLDLAVPSHPEDGVSYA